MTLRLLESLSLPGDAGKPNEDAFAHSDRAALLLDGATPLGDPLLPGPSDAAWIAQFGARRLLAHLKDGDAPREALRHALGDAEKSFAGLARHAIQEKWQTPCASMMLAAEQDSEVQFLWFGDCAALIVESGAISVIGETLEKRAAEAGRAKAWAQQKNLASALGIFRQELIGQHRANRNRINSGRYWLFSPDARAAAHVSHVSRAVAPGALLLLASDGFLALVSDYRAYDAAGLVAAAKAKGLKALGEELRAIEDDDAMGQRYSRFKKSDDATALLIEIV